MGNKTADIAVYPVSAFDAAGKSFWFGSLEKILEKYPFLEHPHRQSFFMLLFVEKANGLAIVDNHSIRLDEPKVISIRPNSVFSLDINRTAAGCVLCFTDSFFSLRYNNNVLYQFAFLHKTAASFTRLTVQQAERWRTILSLMWDETHAHQKNAEKVLRSYLNILLFDLDRKFYEPSTTPKPDAGDEKVIQFEKLVEENYTVYKTPSHYAGQLNITTNYLNRLCHNHRGVTSGGLIRERITIEARRLLHYTTLSVSEIAYRLGFESISYFVTFFKKNTGTTPEQFRKSNN